MNFSEGDRVDYVSKGLSQNPGVMTSNLPGNLGFVSGDAPEETNVRRRAVIDKVVNSSTVRIILTESMETVWAHPDELEQLNVIDKLADMVGPESRSLADGLAEMSD